MAAIPTIKMVKDNEVIIVNAPDRDKYLNAGYEDFKAEPAKEAAKEPEPQAPAAPEQEAPKAEADAKADAKPAGK